jgi:mannose-1-phosphate guanylyltransferase
MNSHWYAIIMAGGAGTRFWPASRRRRPKQLLALGPDTSRSLLTATVARVKAVCPSERIVIATGEHLIQATHEVVPEIPMRNVLAEPVPRNTAPCIAWATASILSRDPEAVIAVLSADHVVTSDEGFVEVINRAMTVAQTGTITTIGIVPTRPETGYGYIEAGVERGDGAKAALRFVEKPDLATAEKMLTSGNYLWNSGFFFFRGRDMMAAIDKHLPDLASGIRKIDAARDSNSETETLKQVFPLLPSVSIDVGVMEKVSPLAVVPGDFGWSDVGSWQTVWELAHRDENDNAAPSGSLLIDSRGNMVADLRASGDKKMIALLGVEDMVVVETEDALLVMPRSRSQELRKLTDALSKLGHHDKL